MTDFAAHGTGFRADTLLHPGDLFPGLDSRQVLGAAPLDSELPPSAVNSDLIDRIGLNNQGQGDACTGEEFAESFGMSLAGQGYPGDVKFSARAAYRGGRRWGNQLLGLPSDAPLPDAGCAPSYVIAAAMQDGIPLASVCPYDETKLVNDQETLAEAVDGAPRAPLVVSAYTPLVEPLGANLVRAVKQALLPRGGRVSLALFASPSFRAADGTKILTASVPSLVNHMVGACDFYTVTSVTGSTCTLAGIDPKTGQPTELTSGFEKVPLMGDIILAVQNSWGLGYAAQSPVRPGVVLVDTAFLFQCAFLYLVRVQYDPTKAVRARRSS